MNVTVPLFDAGELVARPCREAAAVKVTVADDEVTGVAGAALWGPFLDRLNVVDVADRRQLRPTRRAGIPAVSATGLLSRCFSPAGTSCRTGRCSKGRLS